MRLWRNRQQCARRFHSEGAGALENFMLSQMIAAIERGTARDKAASLLDGVGLGAT
jgi:hypothetical protein